MKNHLDTVDADCGTCATRSLQAGVINAAKTTAKVRVLTLIRVSFIDVFLCPNLRLKRGPFITGRRTCFVVVAVHALKIVNVH